MVAPHSEHTRSVAPGASPYLLDSAVPIVKPRIHKGTKLTNGINIMRLSHPDLPMSCHRFVQIARKIHPEQSATIIHRRPTAKIKTPASPPEPFRTTAAVRSVAARSTALTMDSEMSTAQNEPRPMRPSSENKSSRIGMEHHNTPQQIAGANSTQPAGGCQVQGLVDGTGIEAQTLCLCFARNGICIRVNLPC